MDKLESINPLSETTSHLMYECNQRGHTVFFLEPHDVYIRKNEVVARMRNITVPRNLSMKRYWRSLINCLIKDELIFENIIDLDALFLRKNPPLIYQTMEFLTPVNDRVFMINSTSGQILANSKLYTLNFPEIIPETHISRDPTRLRKIIDDFGGSMVVKPLQRSGGEGVIKVSIRDRENHSLHLAPNPSGSIHPGARHGNSVYGVRRRGRLHGALSRPWPRDGAGTPGRFRRV